MAREKKNPKAGLPPVGTGAKLRHEKFLRAQQHDSRVWQQLNPLKEPPKVKHKTYFEAVENKEKKKKLEFQITKDTIPPPGLEFIPTGHPELTSACKELSREQDALFFIVSNSDKTDELSHHMNRVGYHFRQNIVDEARETLRNNGVDAAKLALPGTSQMPESQKEINRQADAVLRDLFPRIPNTDRHEIILHAFRKDGTFNGKQTVGGASELTLARRVQLAALAHIRHNHTRYDELLRESDWPNARKAVEKPCLDIIVKWRGDEETGRDQLDEILREVIEISDTEDDGDESSGEEVAMAAPVAAQHRPGAALPGNQSIVQQEPEQLRQPSAGNSTTAPRNKMTKKERQQAKRERRAAKRVQQRFKRYAAIAEATQQPFLNGSNAQSAPVMNRTTSHNSNHYSGMDHGTPSRMTHNPHSGPMPNHDYNIFAGAQRLDNNVLGDRSNYLPQPPTHTAPEPPPRGQSPLFIRVKDSNAPKVGLPSDRLASVQISPSRGNVEVMHQRAHHPDYQPSLSPVRHHFEDMLVPSIEPRSPDVPHNSRRPLQYDAHVSQQPVDIPRVISRTTVRHPVDYVARRGSPEFIRRADENYSQYHPVAYSKHDRPDLGQDVGFIRLTPVHRGDGPSMASHEYHSDRPLGQTMRTSGGMVARPRSPVIYLGDPAYPTRNQGAVRTSSNPIYTDTPPAPRLTERVVGVRGSHILTDHARGPVELVRDVRAGEVRRVVGGPEVVYVNELRSRVRNAGDYQLEPPHDIRRQVPLPREERPFHFHEPYESPVAPVQPSSRVLYHDEFRVPEFRPVDRGVQAPLPAVHNDVSHYEDTRGSLRPVSRPNSYLVENRPVEQNPPRYGYPIHQSYPVHEAPPHFDPLGPAAHGSAPRRHYHQHQIV